MAIDFERELTRRVWTGDAFAAQAENDPGEALKSMGVAVPDGVKVKIVAERRDRIYFTIPPERAPGSTPAATPLNMDLWSIVHLGRPRRREIQAAVASSGRSLPAGRRDRPHGRGSAAASSRTR